MPLGRKHLTRADMKGDEFVSWVTRATIWVETNSRTVLAGLGAAAAVVVVAIGGFTWIRSSQQQAYVALGEVQKVVRTPLVGETQEGVPTFANEKERASRVVEAADRMLREHAGGRAADWARYHRAAALLELGRNDEAASALEPILAGDPGELLGDLARVLAGRIDEARGNYQQAAEKYADAASRASERFPAEVALMDQARCLAAAGKTQEAIDAYQRIVEVYPDSPLAGKASQRIQELRGEAQGL